MDDWTKNQEGYLNKTFKLGTYRKNSLFVSEVAKISELKNHHPKIIFDYNFVSIFLISHDKGIVTDRDENLSALIDEIYFSILKDDK